MERLAFSYGTGGHEGRTPGQGDGLAPGHPEVGVAAADTTPERRDWAFIGLMAFTALLFFRPQDMVTPLRALHLAELAALFALGSLVAGRLGRGLPVTRTTPELIGVFAFAFVILATAPFSVWKGGAVGTFIDLYSKVVLIFVLMVNTLSSPKRMEQFTWLIVLASGYIGSRAVLDYARGVNLIENGRVQGAVGGMFQNPNDLALNMVAVLPLAALLAVRPGSTGKRGLAALAGLFMVGAVVASQSRSGTVGLGAVVLVIAAHLVKRKPGIVFAFALAGVLALPLMPSSYFQRIASITNEDLDDTGSREARSILLEESWDAFLANPITGVGAGQFKNYNPEGRQEAWRESHNVVLQVAADLGIGGLLAFAFLVIRGVYAPMQTRRLLRTAIGKTAAGRNGAPVLALSRDEQEMILTQATALSAALVGWFVCALFASVAYHWTFYYLLALAAAPREYLQARLAAARQQRRAVASRTATAAGAHA